MSCGNIIVDAGRKGEEFFFDPVEEYSQISPTLQSVSEIEEDEKLQMNEWLQTNKPEIISKLREFDFIENVTENLLNGTFSLTLSGFYKYNVYEQASTTNLNPLLALNLIDKGKLNVVSQLSDYPVYTGNENNTVVYGG